MKAWLPMTKSMGVMSENVGMAREVDQLYLTSFRVVQKRYTFRNGLFEKDVQ